MKKVRKFIKKVQPRMTGALLNQDKRMLRRIAGLITGHCRFKKHKPSRRGPFKRRTVLIRRLDFVKILLAKGRKLKALPLTMKSLIRQSGLDRIL